MSFRHIPALDGLRGVAIILVLFHHLTIHRPTRGVDESLASVPLFGWSGVDVFFVLSGFLITGILIDSKERPRYFRNFYIRRVLRIMPLYFAIIILWAFIYEGAGSYLLLSAVFGANLAYVVGIPEPRGPDVLWSLAVEEHFYLVWPVIVLLLSRRSLLIVSAMIFVATPVLRGIFAARGMEPNLIFLLSWFRFDGLAAGAMIAIWARSAHFSRPIAVRISAAAVAALLIVTAGAYPFGVFVPHSPSAVALRYTQAYLVFGACFVLVLAYAGSAWTSPLRWRLVALSGALSYCIYLVHLSVGDGYERVLAASGFSAVEHFGPWGAVFVRVAVMVVASFGIALLSRKYFDGPILALKDRLAPSSSNRISRQAAAPIRK